MANYETYSKRQKGLAKPGQPDVYRYDDLPPRFRGQVTHILKEAIGHYHERTGPFDHELPSPSNQYWDFIHKTTAEDLGHQFLPGGYDDDRRARCLKYWAVAPTDEALDILELCFRVIDRWVRDMNPYDAQTAKIQRAPDEAIQDLNGRFLEHSLGYQFVDGHLVRMDSQFAHEEIVKPALALLSGEGFDGAADEFMRAVDHHRNGNDKEAVAEALKSLESTMKSICATRKWKYGPKDTAKPLMDLVFAQGLVPPEMQSHFAGLRAALESGLPALANPTRHGQGSTPVEVPPHVTTFALHLMAADIIFLIQCHRTKK
jgi:uncharacterized protein DUF7014/AbiJ-like protein